MYGKKKLSKKCCAVLGLNH